MEQQQQTIDKKDLVSVRDGVEEDRSFILATFLRGLYYGDSWFKEIPKNIFMTNYHKILTTLLDKHGTTVKVACLKDDPSVILAYAIFNHNSTVMHYAFCKKAWRNIGIVKSLVPNSVVMVTHLTKVGLGIVKTHPGIIFNPFALGD